MQTLGLKNINLLTKEQFDGIETPATDELYAVSGSGYGFPSDNYVDLVLTSGETYIAPANGFLAAGGTASAVGGVITLKNKTSSIRGQSPAATTSGYGISAYVPSKLGDEIEIYTAEVNSASFRFVYAEGEI